MPGSLLDALFGCTHRRTTFPMTPVNKTGASEGGTYVVCLECGKQFSYDWEHMRIGKPVDISAGTKKPANPEAPSMRFSTKSKLRMALLASAVPAAWAIGKALKSSRKRPEAKPGSPPAPTD